MRNLNYVLLVSTLLFASCGIQLPPSSLMQNVIPNKHAVYSSEGDNVENSVSAGYSYNPIQENQNYEKTNAIDPDYFRTLSVKYTYSKAYEHYSYALSGKGTYGVSNFRLKDYEFVGLHLGASFSYDKYWRNIYWKIFKVSIGNSFNGGAYEDLLMKFENDASSSRFVIDQVWPHHTPLQNIGISTELGININKTDALILVAGIDQQRSFFKPMYIYQSFLAEANLVYKNHFVLSLGVVDNLDHECYHLGLTYRF